MPSPEGLARLATNRWARSNSLAAHKEILDAFIKLHVSESSAELKPPARDFLDTVRTRLLQLVRDSLARFGDVQGAVYDDVYGEGYDKAAVPSYLPAVSHFQLHGHDLANDKALGAAWVECLAACGVRLPAEGPEAGLGSSAARRGLVYVLSMGEDMAYLRLAQVLLHESYEFKYE